MLFFNIKKVYNFYKKLLKNITNVELLINENHIYLYYMYTYNNNSITFITFFYVNNCIKPINKIIYNR